MPHCSAASITLALIRSVLTREAWVKRVGRLKRRGAHLDRLLDDVIEPGMLQQREDVSDVGQPVLRPGLLEDDEAVRPLAALDRGLPFAVAAVEGQNLGAGGKPQHIAEIVALVAVERDAGSWAGGASTNRRGRGNRGGHRCQASDPWPPFLTESR